MTGRSRYFIFAALVAALLVTGLAASAAVGLTWQGQKSLMPNPMHWTGTCVYQGKIYLFGGNLKDASGNTTMSNVVHIYDPASDTWTAGANMPSARYLCTAVEVGGKIYVMGGRTYGPGGSGGPVDKNEVYDPAANSWTTAKAMPIPVRGHGAAAYNGKVYVIGGNADSYQVGVSIYDPAADSWSAGASMATAVAYGAAATVGNKIYWVGGDLATIASPSDYFGKVISYDPVANTWDNTGVPMLEAVGNYGMAPVDTATGKIYLFGGTVWSDSSGGEVPTATCQVFDTATAAFTQLNFLPSPVMRCDGMAACVSGKGYIIGGDRGPWIQNVELPLVEVYDPVTDTFHQPNAVVPNFGYFAGVAGEIGGKIVAARGAATGVDGKVDIYDPASNTWTTAASANPAPQYYSSGGAFEGKLYITGGVTSTQALTGNTASFDPVSGTWGSLAANPTKSLQAAAAIVDGKLYVFGGSTSWTSAKLSTDLEVLDIAANTWTKKKALPFALEGAVAAASGGKIYIVGGLIGNADTSKKASFNYQPLVYDPAADTYDTSKAQMPSPQAFAAGDVYSGYIFVDGGLTWGTVDGKQYWNFMDQVQVYDITNNAWTSVQGVFCRLNHNVVASGGKLYTFNGLDPDIPSDRLCIGLVTGLGPTNPTAHASASPTTGPAPLHVVFTGGASEGTPPYTYAWAFGDGATSTEQSPTHDYATNGDYSAVLTVTDSASLTGTDSVPIHVGGAAFTVAVAADKTSGPAPLEVHFTATPSGGTSPYTYAWDFKDGGTSTDQNPSHTFAADGTYNVALTCTDSASNHATGNVTITVVSVTPPAVTLMKKSGNPFRFIVTGSNLQNGVQVFIGTDTAPWSPVQWKTTTKVVMKGGSALKTKVPKGTPTDFKFVNPDGGEFVFHWAGW